MIRNPHAEDRACQMANLVLQVAGKDLQSPGEEVTIVVVARKGEGHQLVRYPRALGHLIDTEGRKFPAFWLKNLVALQGPMGLQVKLESDGSDWLRKEGTRAAYLSITLV